MRLNLITTASVSIALCFAPSVVVGDPVSEGWPNPAGPDTSPGAIAAAPQPAIAGTGFLVPGPNPVPAFTGTTIDFEGFAEGVLINSQFSGLGVTFTQDDGGTPMIDNKSFLFAYESSSAQAVLTGSTTGGAPFPTVAGLVADFSPPVAKVGAFLSDTVALGNYTVTIFDGGGGVLDTITVLSTDFPTVGDTGCDASSPWDGTGCGVWVGFDVGSNTISKVQFGPSVASGDAFAIDDLVFEYAPIVPAVSEWGMASVVLLLLAGLTIKFGVMRFRKAA